MANNSASAIWNGGLKDGKGNISTQSGAIDSPYSFKTRFEDDEAGTNPEELIGAALAGCFSMFLSSLLEKAGKPAKHIVTNAKVTLTVADSGPSITKIELTTEADVPDIEDADFQEYAKKAKEGCPVSKALAGVKEITITALLKK